MIVDADIGGSVPPKRHPRAAPLLPVAVGLTLGVAADNAMPAPTLAAVGVFIVGGIVTLVVRRRPLAVAAIILCAACVGAMRHGLADRRLPPNHVAFFAATDPVLVHVEGVVALPPTITRLPPDHGRAFDPGPRTRFLLDVDQLGGRAGPIAVQGRIAASVQGELNELAAGDRVRIFGWLRRPRGPQNPGAYDWALYQRRSGVWANFFTEYVENVFVLQRAGPSGTGDWLPRLRTRLRGYLIRDAFEPDDPTAGVVLAIVMGQRSTVSRELNDAFVRTGTAHFLAASGMNVAWVALAGWVVCRLIGVHYRRAAVFVALLIAFYVLAAEPEPSILRAGVVGLIACGSILLRGRIHSTNWLAASAVAVLFIDPTDLFRPGMQLSFAGAWGILHLTWRVEEWIAPRLVSFLHRLGLDRRTAEFLILPNVLFSGNTHEEPPRRVALRAIARVVQVGLFGSMSAWLATTPLVCYHFSQLSPFGWLTTLLLGPAVFLITLLGFVKLVVSMTLPPLGVPFGAVLAFLTRATLGVVERLSHVPGVSIDGRAPSAVWTLGAYAALLAWVHLRRHSSPPIAMGGLERLDAKPSSELEIAPPARRSSRLHRFAFALAALLLIAGWLTPVRWVRHDSHALRVWMLAVGNGTGTVLELPDGRVLIYDLGTRSPVDVGAVALAFLKERGINHVDAAIVSHPDFDHYSGLPALAAAIPIDHVIVNDHFRDHAPPDSPADVFLKAMAHANTALETISGPRRLFDGAGLTVDSIWPPPRGDRPLHDENDASIVLRVTYQNRSVLLTGDIGDAAIQGLLAAGDLHADALALPHHGAVVHNTPALLAAVDPQFAVRSTGEPARQTINAIADLVRPHGYLSTADDGCVLIEIKSGRLAVTTPTAGRDGARLGNTPNSP